LTQPPSIVKETGSRNTAEHSQKGTYSVVTLGCAKNLVDSERMLGQLQLDGYQFVPEPERADFVLVNTCGFLQAARRESLDMIDEMLDLKRRGVLRGVIVTGCLAEREKTALLESRPGVDQMVGVFSREEISRAADRLMGGIDDERAVFRPAPSHPPVDARRLRLTPPHVAYLKIAEGCDRLCTFCSIPRMRGKYASKSQDDVIAEAEELASGGTRELILVAQDLTYYGWDLDGRPGLASLLGRLEQVDGIEWIRLMYLYPMFIIDDLIEVMATSRKVLPYIDLPLQHINDLVLRRMNRRVSRNDTEAIVDRLRERIEGLVLRTTMIAGFPGETEGQFEELLEYVRRRRFQRLGVFSYSREPDTPAARLDGQLPEEVKLARRDQLMAAQQEIAFAWNEAQVGRRMDVLIDGCIAGEDNAYVGRTYADAPEIDGAVYVTGDGLAAGQIVPCEIVAARQYDLIGAAIAEPK
jgi:ribosomal protein S12 methylthiotransferase